MKNRKIFVIMIIILLIFSLLYIFRKSISNKLFPVYKIEDRTKKVKSFEKKHKNENVTGWIRVQGTNIDYPIVINETYFYDTDAIRTYSYAWVNNKKISNKYNYIPIFGHNVRNVSKTPIIGDNSMERFEQLLSYYYYEFDKNNKYFQITMNNKNYLYQIFSVSIESNNYTIYYPIKMKKNKFKNYINKSIDESLYKFNVEVNESDNIVSLITCTRMSGTREFNFKIDGKLVKNKNIGYNYSIGKKNKNKVVGGNENEA